MALENCPTDARGLMSGILQQGYSFGYVCAACANLGVGGSTNSWKTVFWIAAGLSIGVGFIRICFPESKQFVEAKRAKKEAMAPSAFWKETGVMLRQQWKMCIYCIILMTWFNCESSLHCQSQARLLTCAKDYSHTSQDSYTTFMLTEKELANAGASRASILMKAGACVGGTIIG
jgi:MFS family permease